MRANPIKMVHISSDDIVAALPLFFILCGVIMLVCFLIVRSVEGKNNAFPVQEKNARIIDLRQETTFGLIMVTWILFEFSDGVRIRLTTDIKNDFMVGDEGILKYQGERLVSFERGEIKRYKEGQTELKKKPAPEVVVTQEEVQYIMQRKNIPYAEAVILARKIKTKQFEKRSELR